MTASRRISVLSILTALSLALPSLAAASPISIFAAPDKTFQNTTNSPCVFYGDGNKGKNCPQDPSGWPTPAGPTDGAFSPLTKIYTGADFTTFINDVGPNFILGYDVNDTSTPQTLTAFTVDFFNGGTGGTNLGSYSFSPATSLPSTANGNGYADYLLAAGCAAGLSGSGITATCTTYQPFSAPVGTDTIRFTFSLGTTGNDGAEQIFAIPTDPGGVINPLAIVPEPASLLLMGTGLAGMAAALRRRATRSKK